MRIAWIECPDCGDRWLLFYDPGDDLNLLDCDNCGGWHARLVKG